MEALASARYSSIHQPPNTKQQTPSIYRNGTFEINEFFPIYRSSAFKLLVICMGWCCWCCCDRINIFFRLYVNCCCELLYTNIFLTKSKSHNPTGDAIRMILMWSLIIDETATNNFWNNKNLHIIPCVFVFFIPFPSSHCVVNSCTWFFFSVFLSARFHSTLIAVSQFSLKYRVHCFVRVHHLNSDLDVAWTYIFGWYHQRYTSQWSQKSPELFTISFAFFNILHQMAMSYGSKSSQPIWNYTAGTIQEKWGITAF